MTAEEFALITQRIIEKEGFSDFQPTACYPTRREVKTLAGLPDDIDPENPVIGWAAESADSEEEFLVAFKISNTVFRVIRYRGQIIERRDFTTDSIQGQSSWREDQ